MAEHAASKTGSSEFGERSYQQYIVHVSAVKAALFPHIVRLGESMGVHNLQAPKMVFEEKQPEDAPTTEARYNFESNTITLYPSMYHAFMDRGRTSGRGANIDYSIESEIAHELGHALVDRAFGERLEESSQLIDRQLNEAMATVVGMHAFRAAQGLPSDNRGIAYSILEFISSHEGDKQARAMVALAREDLTRAISSRDGDAMELAAAKMKRQADTLLEQLDLYILPSYFAASALMENKGMDIRDILEKLRSDREPLDGLGGFFSQAAIDESFARRRKQILSIFDELASGAEASGLKPSEGLSYLLTSAASLLQHAEEIGEMGVKSELRLVEIRRSTPPAAQ